MEGMEVPMKEESIQAFLGFLVEPTLSKTGRYGTTSQAANEEVAKQMRAVVLLYNYYLRKQFPHLEFLDALTFCKNAVIMCAKLIQYMGVLRGIGTDQSASEFVQRATVTEKMVKEACDTCEALNSPREILDIHTWPISKVAVFLVDATYQQCILLFGYITKGVWSFVEKDVDGIETSYGGAKGMRKRPIGSISEVGDMRVNETNINEMKKLMQLAFSAVKEQTGIDRGDLHVVAETLVYSLTKAKTSCQLYMMRCRNDIHLKSNPDIEYKWVPVEEALSNVEGPLLENVQCSYEPVSAVSYFHLRPYSNAIHEWLSRKDSANFDRNSEKLEHIMRQISIESNDQDSHAQPYRYTSNKQETVTPNVPCMNAELRNLDTGFMQGPVDSGVAIANSSQLGGCAADPTRRTSMHSCMSSQNLQSPLKGQQTMSMEKIALGTKDGGDAGKLARQSLDKHPVSMQHAKTGNEQFSSPFRSGMHNRRDMEPVQETVNVRTTAEATSNGTKAGGQETCSPPPFTASHGGRLRSNKSNGVHGLSFQHDINLIVGTHEKVSKGIQENWITTDSDVLKAAIEVITEKRNSLFEDLKTCQLQHQSQTKDLLNKITECDAHVNMILGGGNDALMLARKLHQQTSLVSKGNKDVGQRMDVGPRLLMNDTKRRKLSEGILFLRNSSQELNDICVKNQWSIPSYFVSLLSNTHAKMCFYSTVKIRGWDFELEEAGEVQNGETEAKESAASVMLSRLYRMSASSRE